MNLFSLFASFFFFLSFLLKKAFPAKLNVCGAYMSESTGGQWYSDTSPPLGFPELTIVITLAPNRNPNHSFPLKLDNLKKKMLEKVGNELVFLFASFFCLSCSKKSMKEKRK
jgi:hypothetical protein